MSRDSTDATQMTCPEQKIYITAQNDCMNADARKVGHQDGAENKKKARDEQGKSNVQTTHKQRFDRDAAESIQRSITY